MSIFKKIINVFSPMQHSISNPEKNEKLMTKELDESENELEAYSKIFKNKFQFIQEWYIKKAAEVIKISNGSLNASTISRLAILASYIDNVDEIKFQLCKETGLGIQDLNKILEESWHEISGPDEFNRYLHDYPINESQKKRYRQMIKHLAWKTDGKMVNFTSIKSQNQDYIEAVDLAFLSTYLGLASYNEAATDVIRFFASQGNIIDPEEIRSAIIFSSSQIAQHSIDISGELLGDNAKEITVIGCPSPEHANIQGHIFKNSEWEKMQSGLPFQDINGRRYQPIARPIGSKGCHHLALSVNTESHRQIYTQHQLDEILAENEKGFIFEDRHYTLYEGMTMLNQLSDDIRKTMIIAIKAQADDNNEIRKQCQNKIDALGKRRSEISKASGIRGQSHRMTVDGFRPYKEKTEKQGHLTKTKDVADS